MPPFIAACLHGHHVVWILASTQGKHNRRVEMSKVVFLYRTNLPRTVITRPWHVRVNGSPELPEELQFLLVSTREPDARALLDHCLYDNGAVGHLHCRYASNHVLLIFHVARGSETERKRIGVIHPVAVLDQGMLW